LSIVFGTATTRTPSRASRSPYDNVSSPPMGTSQSSPSRSTTRRQWSVKSNGPSDSACPWPARNAGTSRGLTLPGLVREVCSMVPPVRSMVRTSALPSGTAQAWGSVASRS
jgi:hypothetical protein